MSRKHPTLEELQDKANHIAEERAKMSRFRPKLAHENPDNIVHLPIGDANPEPAAVERYASGPFAGMLIGEDKPIGRLEQMPYDVLVSILRKRHDARGLCARATCAFKNSTPEDIEKARLLQGVDFAKRAN